MGEKEEQKSEQRKKNMLLLIFLFRKKARKKTKSKDDDDAEIICISFSQHRRCPISEKRERGHFTNALIPLSKGEKAEEMLHNQRKKLGEIGSRDKKGTNEQVENRGK